MRSNLDNFQVVDIAKDESGYDYYGSVTSGSDAKYIIRRINTAGTEIRFAYGIGSDYSTDWGNRAGLTYVKPNNLSGKN